MARHVSSAACLHVAHGTAPCHVPTHGDGGRVSVARGAPAAVRTRARYGPARWSRPVPVCLRSRTLLTPVAPAGGARGRGAVSLRPVARRYVRRLICGCGAALRAACAGRLADYGCFFVGLSFNLVTITYSFGGPT